MAKQRRGYTIAEYADLWWPSAPTDETMQRRRRGIQPLVDDFGDRALDRGLTDPEARSWAPRHPGHVRYAKGMFTAAVEDGVAERDPFRRCPVRVRKRPVTVPTEAQVLAAADRAREVDWRGYGRELRALILTAAFTGLRASELCALEAGSILRVPDLRVRVVDGKGGVHRDALVIEPEHGPAVVGSALLEQAPEVGRVWVPPTPRLARGEARSKLTEAEVLRIYREPGVSSEVAERLGYPTWTVSSIRNGNKWAWLTNPRPAGHLTRQNIGTLWAGNGGSVPGFRSTVGMDRFRWHDLRHAHATWLLDRGCTAEEVAIQMLGHPNPALIISTYGHPSLERGRQRIRRRVGRG